MAGSHGVPWANAVDMGATSPAGWASPAGIGQKLGFRDAFRQSEAKWFAAVDAALDKNTVTFAVLDIGQMVGPNGYLAKLKAKGYTVLAPDE